MPKEKQLVKESEWMRTYLIGRDVLYYESKFLMDNLEVSAQSLKERWPSLSDEQRLEFASAFAAKGQVSKEDEEILLFLMRSGNETISSTIAVTLTACSEKETALRFLLGLIQHPRPGCANYFQALELLKDVRAIPSLRSFYQEYRNEIGSGDRTRLLAGHYWEIDYLVLCRALLALRGGDEFKTAISEMLSHPDEIVRSRAQRFLESN